MKRITLAIVVLALCAGSSRAAFFSGNAFFSQPPTSQLGPIVFNNIVINNGPGSYTVSGQLHVQVPAGAVTGTLIEWTVDRPLDPNFLPNGNYSTVMTLSGYAQPPGGGTYGPTSGYTRTSITSYPVVSQAVIPLTLTNGAAIWPQQTVNSGVFFYAAGGTNYLRQTWVLDGTKLSGPGGLWIIDLPLESGVWLVPEPGTAALAACAVGLLAVRRRR
ncbi:MAG: hypothetical protein AB7G28_03805 [Pirellulales bacterium]